MSTTRFSSWLDTAIPVGSTHPQPSQQTDRSKAEQLRSAAGSTGPGRTGHPGLPGETRPRGREMGTDRRQQWQQTLRYREGREHIPRARTRRAGGAGLPWRLRRARPVPGEMAMTTPAPFPSTETSPKPVPADLGGAADAPSAHPGRRNRTESGGHGHRRHFLNRAPRSNAPPHWLHAGHVIPVLRMRTEARRSPEATWAAPSEERAR